MKDEILELVKDAAEHVAYLRELGVTGVEATASSFEARALDDAALRNVRPESSAVNPALVRNAQASVTAKPPPKSPRPSTSELQAVDPSLGKPLATKPTTRRTQMVAPLPQDLLFGEIAPAVSPSSLPPSAESLEDIWNDIGDCTRCPLAAGRTHVVNTHGNRNARLMFVGEAPGADEDALARPFVGRAGQLLTKIIEAIGIKREDVLIGNVNRCRPPQNRPPTLDEAKTCKPFILREIAVVRPDVIVVLGNTAMKNLLETKEGITKLRGRFQDFKGIKVMPTFHPAYLLRDPSKKREAWEDMKTVRAYLDSIANEK